jgi:hypothetical protein
MPFLLQRVENEPGLTGGFTRTSQMKHVPGDTLLIGRGAAAQLRLEEASISLEHARIGPAAEGGLEIVDLGSVTGTYVNGQRIDRSPLRQGDWVELGRYRLSFAIEGPGAPVIVHCQQLAEERARPGPDRPAKAAPARAAPIDYLGALSLERWWLRRGLLAALLLATTGAGLMLVVHTERAELFRPGAVSAAHGPIATRCAACHTPWRGPRDDGCIACHAGPEHQPTQVSAPACVGCHLEHRSEPLLRRVADAQCVACHGELTVKGGGQPFFARRVTDFGTDHPRFSLTFADGAALSRLPLAAAIASGADPTVLAFGHELHLRADLRGPRGPTQLDCLACHTPSAGDGELQPVRFGQHCQGCHALAFDPRFREAPHGNPAAVHAFLLRAYVETRPSAAPLPAQRRLLPRREAAGSPPLLRLDQSVLRQVVEAELNLYRSACARCHEVDLSGALPAVSPPAIPARWLEHAAFDHHPHRAVPCVDCHAAAPRSQETGDVLLPDIDTCRRCHSAARPGPRAAGGATTRCISCHVYHDKSRAGEWGATTSPSAREAATH